MPRMRRRLVVLLGALELVGVVAEQLLHVGDALGVEVAPGATLAPLPSRRSSASRSRPHSSLTRM